MIDQGSVKICSLREVEHARFVLDAGADIFGLIFVPGVRRQVATERAAEIVAAVRQGASGRPPRAAGVFVDAPADEINRIAEAVGLDVAQLHGNEPAEILGALSIPAIKTIQPPAGTDVDAMKRVLERYWTAATPPIAFHIEGGAAGHGGQGARADWELAALLAREYPVVLAGGLGPEIVAEAIAAVNPLAVDVSSGVETDGEKDPGKIAKFTRNAKAAFLKENG